MENPFFISQVMGIILCTASLGFALQPEHYQKVFRELMGQASLKFISGMIPLIIGTLLVLSYHQWTSGWDKLVGVMCWLIFIKGIMRIMFPLFSDRMTLKYINRLAYLRVFIACALLIGLALCYHGFVSH